MAGHNKWSKVKRLKAVTDVPISLHGAISTGPKGNRVYFGYGTNTDGVLQIVDREKLLKGAPEPTVENLLAPQVSRLDMPPMHGAQHFGGGVIVAHGIDIDQPAHLIRAEESSSIRA